MRALRFGSYSIAEHLGRHVVLVPLEVDLAVLALVAAALVPHRDAAEVVAAAGPRQRLEQRLLGLAARDLREVRDRAEPLGRRHGLEFPDGHSSAPPVRRSRRGRWCRPWPASRPPSSSRRACPA